MASIMDSGEALSRSDPATVAAQPGFSGQEVRGIVESSTVAPSGPVPAPSDLAALENTVRTAGEQMLRGLDDARQALGHAVENAADSAATGPVSSLGQSSFSWGGYTQAVGILFLLLALLWLLVWLVRRYGRFNFLPRPGALPRDALVMEAQMPLGPRKGLMVVRFLNRRLLLGVTDQQITLLTEESAHHEPHNADFHDIMEEARRAGPAGGKPADPPA